MKAYMVFVGSKKIYRRKFIAKEVTLYASIDEAKNFAGFDVKIHTIAKVNVNKNDDLFGVEIEDIIDLEKDK